MSKLEKIKEEFYLDYKHAEMVILMLGDRKIEDLRFSTSLEKFKYLIKQAERVEELENENKKLKEFQKQWHENMFGKENISE